MFDHIVGNEHAKKYLKRIVDRNTVPQSILFTGPEGVGKSLFAEALARYFGAVPSDFHIYRPEGKIGMHSMESMRSFCDEVFLPPYCSKRKFLVIESAERMLNYSSNALLKAFEEPPAHTIIILLTHNPAALLPTVQSRCYQIRFQPLSQKELIEVLIKKFQSPLDIAQRVADKSDGSLGKALETIERKEDQSRIKLLLSSFLTQGEWGYFPCIVDLSKEISDLVESEQKKLEEQMKQELADKYPGGLTSVQQHAYEQEISGAISLFAARQVSEIGDFLLGWFRDMLLLYVNGDRKYLLNKESLASLEEGIQVGHLRPLERVEEAVKEAKLAYARFLPLASVLESLLVRILKNA